MRDDRTGRYIIHIHTFRKFFSSRMALSCPRDAVEMLMGHEGYLSGAYRRFSEEQLMDLYKKSMQEVTILEVKPVDRDVEKMKTIVKGFIDLYGADTFKELMGKGVVSQGRLTTKEQRMKMILKLQELAEEL